MKESLLLHILTGKATSNEKEEFYRHLENNEKEKELFYEVKSLWLRITMQHTLVDVDSEFEDLWQKIKKEKRTIIGAIGRRILRYAAMVIIILGIGGTAGYFISQKSFEYPDTGIQKYTAMRGSVSIVEFPDGTKIWLNSESELTFREDHKNKQRLAELSGEAYFEVAHQEDFPFVVKVGKIVVRDLGTTFNIKAYADENYIETSLVEGKADILTATGKTILTLEPGESAMYHSVENRMELRSISDNVLSAWRDGKFVVRDQRLEDIFKELSRWYGIEFRFENNKLRNYRFTGNIKKTTTAVHVLKVLKATTEFNYRIIENVDKPDTIIVY
jgi:ferric-dicitrate binding protein FerR (iron transport regulator)